MPIPADTLDRIYAGFLGKAIGVRLGAPVEPTIWTWDRIDKTYGEITGYLRDFKNFAADDDTNGPVYFIRALRDFGLDPSPQDVGRTWLNYAAELHGMFWWGGYGISTEHTAFANLQSGVPAPESGLHAIDALHVCRLARETEPCAPERVHPVYVRQPDAEIARSARDDAQRPDGAA